MDTITLAARKITRTLNDDIRKQGVGAVGQRYYFDADGELVARLIGPPARSPKNNTYSFFWKIEVDKRGDRVKLVTRAEVQEALDAEPREGTFGY